MTRFTVRVAYPNGSVQDVTVYADSFEVIEGRLLSATRLALKQKVFTVPIDRVIFISAEGSDKLRTTD